jgi:hypothetical protein
MAHQPLRQLPIKGFSFQRDTQAYVCIAIRPYLTTKILPGRTVLLIDWATACPTCTASFITSSVFPKPPQVRRCKLCRKPLYRVTTELKQRNA